MPNFHSKMGIDDEASMLVPSSITADEILHDARVAHRSRVASMAHTNHVLDERSSAVQRRTSLVRLQFEGGQHHQPHQPHQTHSLLSPQFRALGVDAPRGGWRRASAADGGGSSNGCFMYGHTSGAAGRKSSSGSSSGGEEDADALALSRIVNRTSAAAKPLTAAAAAVMRSLRRARRSADAATGGGASADSSGGSRAAAETGGAAAHRLDGSDDELGAAAATAVTAQLLRPKSAVVGTGWWRPWAKTRDSLPVPKAGASGEESDEEQGGQTGSTGERHYGSAGNSNLGSAVGGGLAAAAAFHSVTAAATADPLATAAAGCSYPADASRHGLTDISAAAEAEAAEAEAEALTRRNEPEAHSGGGAGEGACWRIPRLALSDAATALQDARHGSALVTLLGGPHSPRCRTPQGSAPSEAPLLTSQRRGIDTYDGVASVAAAAGSRHSLRIPNYVVQDWQQHESLADPTASGCAQSTPSASGSPQRSHSHAQHSLHPQPHPHRHHLQHQPDSFTTTGHSPSPPSSASPSPVPSSPLPSGVLHGLLSADAPLPLCPSPPIPAGYSGSNTHPLVSSISSNCLCNSAAAGCWQGTGTWRLATAPSSHSHRHLDSPQQSPHLHSPPPPHALHSPLHPHSHSFPPHDRPAGEGTHPFPADRGRWRDAAAAVMAADAPAADAAPSADCPSPTSSSVFNGSGGGSSTAVARDGGSGTAPGNALNGPGVRPWNSSVLCSSNPLIPHSRSMGNVQVSVGLVPHSRSMGHGPSSLVHSGHSHGSGLSHGCILPLAAGSDGCCDEHLVVLRSGTSFTARHHLHLRQQQYQPQCHQQQQQQQRPLSAAACSSSLSVRSSRGGPLLLPGLRSGYTCAAATAGEARDADAPPTMGPQSCWTPNSPRVAAAAVAVAAAAAPAPTADAAVSEAATAAAAAAAVYPTA